MLHLHEPTGLNSKHICIWRPPPTPPSRHEECHIPVCPTLSNSCAAGLMFRCSGRRDDGRENN